MVPTTTTSIDRRGGLSLRQAIAYANALPGGRHRSPSIPTVFATPQTITLAGTQLDLSDHGETLTITGPAAGC